MTFYASRHKFDADLVTKIKAQNSEFIDYMLGLGVTISSPLDGAHVVERPASVSGTYRVRPRPGDNVVLFVRVGSAYYPQTPISWSQDRDKRTWECPRVWLGAGGNAGERHGFGIVVARVGEDLAVWLRSYGIVHELTKHWIGAEMPTLPPGFQVLSSINVTHGETQPPGIAL